jgi:8-oxo-dGTP pyrophosphatase MutT (NUDIX family)
MMHSVQAALFRVWGKLPTSLRRRVVRLLSPSFTAGANCVVINDRDSVLLVRHSYRADWGLPGGLIQRHEEPHVAAVRETREEIGLDVTLIGPPEVLMDPHLQQIDFVFRASPVSGSTAAPRSAEIIEVAWFTIDALPSLQRDARESLGALGLL